MNDVDWKAVIESLRATTDICFEPGLTDAELQAVEVTHQFRFPPDLRAFLQAALPVGDQFPNWRAGDPSDLAGRLEWPLDGICFDIEHADFWLTTWQTRPDSLAEACEIARRHVSAAPTLIPIYSHRYLPADPPQAGNPVFSVYQTDIIYYGRDLLDYLSREFQIQNPRVGRGQPRTIEFWGELVDGA